MEQDGECDRNWGQKSQVSLLSMVRGLEYILLIEKALEASEGRSDMICIMFDLM